MSYTVSIAEATEKDLHEAFRWYEEKQILLRRRFESSVSNAIRSIQQNPLQSPKRYKETRVRFLHDFPYGIHYRVHEHHILIIAVFHTARNPERWKSR